jgi:nitroimidazol reductase NimA-like FMN-containing flavoprotein (pyridoxamine 5'-phosphate oxidase superfamily)
MAAKSIKRKAEPRKQSSPSSGTRKAPVASQPILPASYGVKTTSKSLLDWDWAHDRLTKSENFVVVTVYPDGRPHAMGMHGMWFEDAFYFGTGKKTRKARNLVQNPRCVIINDRLEELVIVEGTAEIVSLTDLPKGLSEKNQEKYGWPLHEGRDSSIYKVRPTKVFGIPVKQFGTAFTRWTFE